MADLAGIVLALGCVAAWEMTRLGRQNRRKEMVCYAVLCLAGVMLFGLVMLWKDMPSLYDLLKGPFGGQ